LLIDVFFLFVSVLNQLHHISIYNAPAAKWHFNFSALWLDCSEHSVFIFIALL
jgi:hypothetical protein